MDRTTTQLAAAVAATYVVLAGSVRVMDGAAAGPPSARQLYEAARERYARMDSYIARLTRREVVRGERRPEEVILFKFRETPWSAYMKWLGEEGRGREGLYVKGQHGDRVHVRLAGGDMPFVPAGRRMALAPDGALLRSASPHPITEAGLGASIAKVGEVVSALGRGDRRRGELAVVGPERRPEFAEPPYGVEHRLPAGADPALPEGGRRTYYFDPVTSLPTLFVTHDHTGREVEYYRYDRLQPDVGLNDADFDPDRLWAPPPDPTRGAPSAPAFSGPNRP
ncbi:MAG: DUF1571 domain-containing protein [Gemmataceae bacterium]